MSFIESRASALLGVPDYSVFSQETYLTRGQYNAVVPHGPVGMDLRSRPHNTPADPQELYRDHRQHPCTNGYYVWTPEEATLYNAQSFPNHPWLRHHMLQTAVPSGSSPASFRLRDPVNGIGSTLGFSKF